MRFPLDTAPGRRDFQQGIVGLVEQGHLGRAEYLLVEAVRELSEPALAAAAEGADAPVIEGWAALVSDMIEADAFLAERQGGPVGVVALSVVNRDTATELRVERSFHRTTRPGGGGRLQPDPQGPSWSPPSEVRVPIVIRGLEPFMAIQRQPYGPFGPSENTRLLADLLVVTRVHRVIAGWLEAPGLPRRATVFVGMDHVPWPMEAGVVDFGPQARRILQPEPSGLPEAAAGEMLAERMAARDERHRAEIARAIAEMREIHRLLSFFPFYRAKARDQLGETFTLHLQSWCDSQGFSKDGVGWRMDRPTLERLLRRIAEAKCPSAVDQVLDTGHVDALHASWVAKAVAADFDLGAAPMSLFELWLAWGLRFGGPVLHDRWTRASAYSA